MAPSSPDIKGKHCQVFLPLGIVLEPLPVHSLCLRRDEEFSVGQVSVIHGASGSYHAQTPTQTNETRTCEVRYPGTGASNIQLRLRSTKADKELCPEDFSVVRMTVILGENVQCKKMKSSLPYGFLLLCVPMELASWVAGSLLRNLRVSTPDSRDP